jgi:hypothetical protein
LHIQIKNIPFYIERVQGRRLIVLCIPGHPSSAMEVDEPQQQQQQQPSAADLQAEFTSAVHRCGHAAWNSSTAEQHACAAEQKSSSLLAPLSTQAPC